jgi:hypothetical protein
MNDPKPSTYSGDEHEVRRYFRIRALTTFPKAFVSDLSQGLPQKLEFDTRVQAQQVQIDDYALYLMPYAGPETPWFQDKLTHELVYLILKHEAATIADAVDRVSSLIDPVIDDLAFQLQEPLKVHELEFLDVTAPVAVGDEREMLLFPFPGGYDQLKLRRSTALGAALIAPTPVLRQSYATLTAKLQQALDWYIKALHASFDVDRYIFLWVSFEVLRGLSGFKVEEPTKLRCGHTISQCPECGQGTDVYRQGQTTIGFLVSLGVDQETAEQLWRMRQIVHGARNMTAAELSALAGLLPILRAVTLACLKQHLGIEQNQPPLLTAGGPTFSMPYLGGHRAIAEADLDGT